MSATTTAAPGPPCYDDGDTAWVSLSTILVLTMMPALALFEAGLLRSQNTVSVLTQVRRSHASPPPPLAHQPWRGRC